MMLHVYLVNYFSVAEQLILCMYHIFLIIPLELDHFVVSSPLLPQTVQP